MVLEIPNLFGNTVDGAIKGSPLNGIIASPYGISLIIILLIIFIYYLSYHDEMGTKEIVGTLLYMILTVVGLIYIHDHAILTSQTELTTKAIPIVGAGAISSNKLEDKPQDINSMKLAEIQRALTGTNILPITGAADQEDDLSEDESDGESSGEYFVTS